MHSSRSVLRPSDPRLRSLDLLIVTGLVLLGGLACDAAPPPVSRLPAVPRIVAIGDLHGDLSAARRALTIAGAIDEHEHWIGGDLVVVQTGDILDRGDDEQAILDLLHRLASEAAVVGGALHVLHGNHELMNVDLDFRYVTPGGFEDFEYTNAVEEPDPQLLELEQEQRARAAAFRPGGTVARLIAPNPVVLIIGDNVFAHGGVLPRHIDYGLDRINAEVEAWLLGERSRPPGILKSRSPVWARTYSDEVEPEDCATLDQVLERLAARRMVVAHTVQEQGITSYCDARVWCIDTGLSIAYGGVTQVLEITGDEVRVLHE